MDGLPHRLDLAPAKEIVLSDTVRFTALDYTESLGVPPGHGEDVTVGDAAAGHGRFQGLDVLHADMVEKGGGFW